MIKNKLEKLKLLGFLFARKIAFLKETGGEKRFPKVLQLPITYRCNSRCKVCNIWKTNKRELSLSQFESIFSDNIFKNIKSVGVNGGEPFLLNNLEEYIKVIIKKFHNLKSLNIITNGFETETILNKTPIIYSICKKNNVSFSVSISLDGVGIIHEKSRGVSGAFDSVYQTIKEMKNNINRYADSFSVACTISKINEDYLPELNSFAEVNNVKIKYRMAVDINRLENDSLYKKYNAFSDFSAREFIFRCFKKSKGLLEKFRYYSIFVSIISNRKKRLLGCNWKNYGIMLDPYGNIYYCAVKSKAIGNLLDEKGNEAFFAEKNINYRKDIIKKCDTCAHDYEGKIYYKDLLFFTKELLKETYWAYLYRIKRFFI